jgi:hypothetical protein
VGEEPRAASDAPAAAGCEHEQEYGSQRLEYPAKLGLADSEQAVGSEWLGAEQLGVPAAEEEGVGKVGGDRKHRAG